MRGKYFTVVFQVSDRIAFQDELGRFTQSMMGDPHVFDGANVTGCGWGDSMSEAEIYAEALTENGIDVPEVEE